MQRFRTITGFVRALIALFVVAQFAGVVSSPLASTEAFANAIASHDQYHKHAHFKEHGLDAEPKGDQNSGRVDHCCAVHAFFVGVLPPMIALQTMDVVGQELAADVADVVLGVAPGRLDRPPRPLL